MLLNLTPPFAATAQSVACPLRVLWRFKKSSICSLTKRLAIIFLFSSSIKNTGVLVTSYCLRERSWSTTLIKEVCLLSRMYFFPLFYLRGGAYGVHLHIHFIGQHFFVGSYQFRAFLFGNVRNPGPKTPLRCTWLLLHTRA
jgi:hypothetical protein